jgi:(R,R)-butanediol dehydrogenase/meso-butanediol dehydrogenase/diacetyl reductase
MRAAVLRDIGRVELSRLDIPEPSESEARIKVNTVGVCGTDLHIMAGKHSRAKPPLIMGHEFCGTIDKISTPRGLQEGDRVVVMPVLPCGVCRSCRDGLPNTCEHLRVLGVDRDGAFAEYAIVPGQNLFAVPDGVSDLQAALVEPVAVAVHAVRLSRLKVGDALCVLGSGPIGLLIALVARLAGAATPIVAEKQAFRLRVAEQLGLIALDVEKVDLVREVRRLTGDEGAAVVFEAAGAPSTFKTAPELCRVHGQVIVVAQPPEPLAANLHALHAGEIDIRCTRLYTASDFRTALRIVAEAGQDLQPLQSEPYSLDTILEAWKPRGQVTGPCA